MEVLCRTFASKTGDLILLLFTKWVSNLPDFERVPPIQCHLDSASQYWMFLSTPKRIEQTTQDHSTHPTAAFLVRWPRREGHGDLGRPREGGFSVRDSSGGCWFDGEESRT